MSTGRTWKGKVQRDARMYVRAMLPAPCWRCGVSLTTESKWTVGHIIDREDGGKNEPSNYAPECARCNFGAGGKRSIKKMQAANAARKNYNQRIRSW